MLLQEIATNCNAITYHLSGGYCGQEDFNRDLYEEGVYAVGFFFPVVPKGQARIRTQMSAAHEEHHLDTAIAAFKKVGQKHGILGLSKKELIARSAA